MAGSWKHAVNDDGTLRGPEDLNQMLENGGDVYEFAEEVYGMIWWLAETLSFEEATMTPEFWVEEAWKNYLDGIKYSPGVTEEG